MSRIEPRARFVGTPANDATSAPTIVEPPASLPAEPAPAPAPAAPPAFVPMPFWRAAIYAISSIVLGITQGLGLNLVTSNVTGLQGAHIIVGNEAVALVHGGDHAAIKFGRQ